ncbi:hypothetical protein FRX31_030594 [Thalictrum thalictroides]|uniref:Uncharacterized protein n=1 Tax=Thalictrum thalictroides TaxID=46969 RepID=A0A7J6V6L4_THATH|nr:hypothetical protein FRX31_030594 [Thalictrum thalictroides]
MKITQESEAICVLQEDKAIEKLLSPPSLSSWEGMHSFRKWRPEDGALKPEQLKGDVNVTFVGIPYHLPVKSVIESLAKKCGGNYVIDDEDIDFCKASCTILVKNASCGSFPSSIIIEERGYKFVVVVETTRCSLPGKGNVIGVLPETNPFVMFDVGPEIPDLVPQTACHMSPLELAASVSIPPGFEIQNLNFTPVGQPVICNSLAVRKSINPVSNVHVTDPVVGVENQNMFEPLSFLDIIDGPNMTLQQEKAHESPVDEEVQAHTAEDEDCFSNSELIRPTIQPSNYLGYRRKHKKKRPAAFKSPFMGHNKWTWITGTDKQSS